MKYIASLVIAMPCFFVGFIVGYAKRGFEVGFEHAERMMD